MEFTRDQLRLDVTHLDAGAVKRTPQGGLDVPANLTRTGVFLYHNADGTTRSELRLAQDVFDAGSLDTLAGAPLTVGHPGLVRSDNWQKLAVGHVSDTVKAEGKFVSARVRVQDAGVVAKVEAKELSELSCGYTCDIEPTAGSHNGEHYDAIQRNIRYNHVALGGKDWGRAGGDVKLRLDSGACVSLPYANDMSESLETLQGQLAAANARADAAEAKLGQIDIDALVAERLALVDGAREVLGSKEKFDGKSDLEIKTAVASKAFPNVRLDGKSADYVTALCAAAVEQVRAGVKHVKTANVRVDADSLKDNIKEARDRAEARAKLAWKGNSK